MKHGCTLLFALALTSSSFAQNALNLRLDTVALNGIVTDKGVPTADGGIVLMVPETGGMSLLKCDATGTAQWRSFYPSGTTAYPAADITPCVNGDVLLAYANTQILWNMFGLAFDVWRIDPNGSVVWHHHYAPETFFGYSWFLGQGISIKENDQSGIFVLMHGEDEQNTHVAVTKIDQSGAIVWNRQVGGPFGMGLPCPGNWCHEHLNLYPDQQGGCRLTLQNGDQSHESALAVSLAANGSLAWASQFDYLGTVTTWEMFPHVVNGEGTTILVTMSNSSNGGMHIVQISGTGTLLKVDRYDINSYWEASLGFDQGTLIGRRDNDMFTVNEDGTLGSGSTLIGYPSDTDFTYQMGSGHFSVDNGRVLFYGGFTATPTGPGLPLASPAFMSFGITDEAVCGRAPFSVVHDVLPNSLFTCAAMPMIGSESVAISVTDGSVVPMARPLLTTVDLCTTTAITALYETPAAFSVNRTTLLAGEVLTVTSDRPFHYSIMDVKGSVVWIDARVNQRLDIPTTELTSGLYMLMGRDLTGRVVGTAKVVVER